MTTTIPGAMARPARTSNGQRFEGFVLVLILLTVGGFAGAASFTHVHDWTMHNSPTHTGDWFGWANAVVSELVPIAALLVMRHRRRTNQSVAYPTALLVGALILSVTAQLAVAKPGFFGGLVSVVPALAFAALAKLVLGKTPAPEQAAIVPDAAKDRPRFVPTPAAIPVSEPSTWEPRPAPTDIVPAPSPATADRRDEQDDITELGDDEDQAVTAELVSRARSEAAAYLKANGKPITRDELRARLRVANGTASELLRQLRTVTPRTGLGPLTIAARLDADHAVPNGTQVIA